MKAAIVSQFGDPSVLEVVDIPEPTLEAGHVIIQVAASSLNPVDAKIRRYGPDFAPALPAVLHGDVAGTIVAVGKGVEGLTVGDEVYACAGGVRGTGGAIAELMLADADLVAPKPRSLTMEEAATLPLVTITAWDGLIDRARVGSDQTVLVYGGTGGVGHIGIQLARWAGARVIATASSPQKAAIASEWGADDVVDYTQESVVDFVRDRTNGRGADVVFDTVGKSVLSAAFEAAALNGTVVSISTRTTADLSPLHAKGLTLHVVFMLIPLLYGIDRAYHGTILSHASHLADNGKLKPLSDSQQFGFSEVADAHRYWESGQAIGKISLVQDFI